MALQVSTVEVQRLIAGQRSIQQQLVDIHEAQKDEERKRLVTVILASLGALLAAVRLGIIFAPKVRRRPKAAPAPAVSGR